MKNIYTIIIFVFFLIFAISGITIRFEQSFGLSNPLFVVGGLALLIVTIISNGENLKLELDVLFYIYFSFITSAVFSSLLNQDFNSFASSVKLLLLYLCIVTVISNNRFINFNIIIFSFISACLLIVVYSIVTVPLDEFTVRYKGVFENPNSMGMLSATMFTIIISLFQRTKGSFRLLLTGLLLISLFLVFSSGSRTAFLTVIGITIVISCNYMIFFLREKRIPKLKIKHFITIILIIVCGVIFMNNERVYQSFDSNIVNKFSEKTDNITSSRTELWEFAFLNSGMIGKGSEFIKNEIGFTAHNSFLAIMMEYGWFAGFLYIMFWLFALIKSFFYGIYERDLLPMLFVSNFIFLSMMEVLTVHIGAMVAVVGLSYIIFMQKKKDMKVTEI